MATITARDIIKKALKEIRVLSSMGGQAVDAEVEDDAFVDLNNILEMWSLENLMVPAWTEETATLTASRADNTVGSGGQFANNYPLEISLLKGDNFIRRDNLDYPVDVITMDGYRAIRNKTIEGRPFQMALQPEHPLAKIFLYYTPSNSTDVLHYRARAELDSFSSVTDTVDIWIGYEKALISNLAVEIAPRNGKRAEDIQITIAKAAADKDRIERQNAAPIPRVRMNQLARLTTGRGFRSIEEGPFS